MKYVVKPNPNDKIYTKMTEAVEKAGFFCPCFLERENPDFLCICKDFREKYPDLTKETSCFCHCRRFIKVAVPENDEEKAQLELICEKHP